MVGCFILATVRVIVACIYTKFPIPVPSISRQMQCAFPYLFVELLNELIADMFLCREKVTVDAAVDSAADTVIR